MDALLEFFALIIDCILHIFRPPQPDNGRKPWVNALLGYLKLFGVLLLIAGVLALLLWGWWALLSTLPGA